jgi:hypothetical protein
MLHDHDLADNIFARLEVSKPHHKQTARENFCTEALVWCLRNARRFRRAFIRHCLETLNTPVPADPTPEISSQVAAKTKPGLSRLRRGQYDIELLFQTHPPARIVVEAKVDSAVNPGQLLFYDELLKADEIPSSLLLLVSEAKKIPADARHIPKVFWETIYQLALNCVNSKPSGRAPAGADDFVLDQFVTFLESLGFVPVNIKLSPEAAACATDVAVFLNSFQQILLKLKNNAELQAPHRIPVLEKDEKQDITWLGLYLADPYYKEGWVGLELVHRRAPTLLFEALLTRPAISSRGFVGKVKRLSEGSATRLQIRKELDPSSLSTASITDWITSNAATMRKTARRKN